MERQLDIPGYGLILLGHKDTSCEVWDESPPSPNVLSPLWEQEQGKGRGSPGLRLLSFSTLASISANFTSPACRTQVFKRLQNAWYLVSLLPISSSFFRWRAPYAMEISLKSS